MELEAEHLVEGAARGQPQAAAAGRGTQPGVARPSVSVLVPIYNEEENIPPLVERLYASLIAMGKSFEIVMVDDGSKDNSWALLNEIALERKEVRAIRFVRNYGQTAAMVAAIDYAEGAVLVPIDADLQNDPADIPRLLEKLEEGYDVVSGWRKERKDERVKRNFLSRVANGVISWVSGVHLHDYGCTLKAYRAKVIKGARLYGEMHRFVPIYATWLGGKVTEIPVNHAPRLRGKSNYGMERIIKVMLDIMVVKFLERHFNKPIYIFGGAGLLALFVSFSAIAVAAYLKLFEGISFISTPLPLMATMCFVTGVMSILLGLIAEMLVRTYYESQDKTIYIVDEIVGGH